MSDLPSGWDEAPLDDLGEWTGGGTPDKGNLSFWNGGSVPWVSPKDMKQCEIADSKDRITVKAIANSAVSWIESGSILVVTRSGILRHSLPVGVNSVPVTINQDLKALTPAKGVNSHYVAQYLRATAKTVLAECSKAGVTVESINFDSLKKFAVPIAPTNEQGRIVEKVDSLLGCSMRARDELGLIPRLIERYKQAVLTRAFRGELTAEWRKANPPGLTATELVDATPAPQQSRGGRGATESVIDGRAALSVNVPNREPPEGWAWVSLRRIARQETGHTPSRKHPEYWDGDIPWIGIADANEHHGGVIHDTIQHVTQAGLDNSSARLLPAGTVCLSRTASVGYVIRMGRDMATSQDFVTWTCSGALDPEYLVFALLAEGDGIRRFGKGSTHKTIYFPEVRAFHICLAPLEEQKEIVRRVKAALAWIDRIAHQHESAAHLLSKLDQAILAKAFRGELVPQDPEDEPASVLLERIREERAKQLKPKRGRRKKGNSA